MTETPPSFPPLLRGLAARQGSDPFAEAIARAKEGTHPGLIVYRIQADRLGAAIVLAPEAPLGDAMAALFAGMLGLSDALGALAPPETAIHVEWPARFRVNGARCGGLRVAASTRDPSAEPDWLVLSLDMPFLTNGEPGQSPDRTVLYEEGCVDVTPTALLESWSRHMLVWINRWLDDGMAPLHADWMARVYGLETDISVQIGDSTQTGHFLGTDEQGGLLLRQDGKTGLFPLTEVLET